MANDLANIFDDDPPTARVLCTGKITDDDLTMLAIKVGFATQEHGLEKILINLTNATLGFPPDGLCRLLDIYTEYRVPVTTRSAVTLTARASPQEYSAVLQTCKEYGYSVVLLTGKQWVKAWLADES